MSEADDFSSGEKNLLSEKPVINVISKDFSI